jgi:hypothetical protein
MQPHRHPPERGPEAAIPPRTYRWPLDRKLGFGALALVPLLLLIAALFAAFVTAAVGVTSVAAMLMYVHVGAQFLVLVLYAHLLVGNPSLDAPGKVLWAAFMLVLAPAATLAYWYVHVWHAEPPERRHDVHVVELHESHA